jgi:hypothetical protein
LFDYLAEGIASLFVFSHGSGHLALVKSSGSRFQFRANAAINLRFVFWECFNSFCGYDIAVALSNELAHRISVFVNDVVGCNAEHIPRMQCGTYPKDDQWKQDAPELNSESHIKGSENLCETGI